MTDKLNLSDLTNALLNDEQKEELAKKANKKLTDDYVIGLNRINGVVGFGCDFEIEVITHNEIYYKVSVECREATKEELNRANGYASKEGES